MCVFLKGSYLSGKGKLVQYTEEAFIVLLILFSQHACGLNVHPRYVIEYR